VFQKPSESGSHAVKSQFKEEKGANKFNILNWGDKIGANFKAPPEPSTSAEYQRILAAQQQQQPSRGGGGGGGNMRLETGPFAPTAAPEQNSARGEGRPQRMPTSPAADGWAAILQAQAAAAEEKARAEKEKEKLKKAQTNEALRAQMEEHKKRETEAKRSIIEAKARQEEQARRFAEEAERVKAAQKQKQMESLEALTYNAHLKKELERRQAEMEEAQGRALVDRAKMALLQEKEKLEQQKLRQKQMAAQQEIANAEGLRIKEARAREQRERDEQLAKEYASILEREEKRRKADLEAMHARQTAGAKQAASTGEAMRAAQHAEDERRRQHVLAAEAKKEAAEAAKRAIKEESNQRMLETLAQQVERKEIAARAQRAEDALRGQRIKEQIELADAADRAKKAAAKQSKEAYRMQLVEQARALEEQRNAQKAGGMTETEARLNAKFLVAAGLSPPPSARGAGVLGRAGKSITH
jgi:hypothetical protein